MLRTWLTDRFDLRVPVVSAPMAGVAGGRLAAAVSAAGALGTIGYAGGNADGLREQARLAAAEGKAFGIGLLAWTLPYGEDLLEVALEAGAALVSVSYGDVARYLPRIRAAGAVAVTQVGTVAEARSAVDAGADVVVARGGEGGGHGRNEVATLPLLSAVLDEVDVPVLAAGGVANARGLAAVLAAGAAGAWVGTGFAACVEADSKPEDRDAIVAADETSTVYTTVLDMARRIPWPSEFGGRALRTSYSDRWHGREQELAANPEPMQERIVWAGQAAGMVRAQRSAAEVVADLAAAEGLLARVCADVTGG